MMCCTICITGIPAQDWTFWIDIFSKVAMVLIAIANCYLGVHIFRVNKKASKDDKANLRKFELIQSLILEPNIGKIYTFYNNVESECKRLLKDDTQDFRKITVSSIKDEQKEFRLHFINLTAVIDKSLYNDLLKITDELVDGITVSTADEGINLSHEPKFDEVILQAISKSKTRFISRLSQIDVVSK